MPKNPPVAPADRAAALQAERRRKMAASAHAFVRGSTARFYARLAERDRPRVPQGPPIWICGDCHVGNLGPIASPSGAIAIQIRDLDQTVIGNPAHDVIRLALSLAMAARSAALPGIITAHMLERMLSGYESAFHPDLRDKTLDEEDEMPPTARRIVRAAAGRSWRHLMHERLDGARRALPLGKHFWPLTAGERAEVEALFGRPELRRLATLLRARPDDAPVHVLDAAFWRKGCSSLGNLRIAVLVAVGQGTAERHCLMDIKAATAPAAPGQGRHVGPGAEADRVVAGARALSPFLGQRMIAADLAGQPVFVRELLPQDLKLDIESISADEAAGVAEFLAHIVGRAHARQLDDPARAAWIHTLHQNRPANHDAPTWLWQTLLDLIATHEAAYLDHCRTWAFPDAAQHAAP